MKSPVFQGGFLQLTVFEKITPQNRCNQILARNSAKRRCEYVNKNAIINISLFRLKTLNKQFFRVLQYSVLGSHVAETAILQLFTHKCNIQKQKKNNSPLYFN